MMTKTDQPVQVGLRGIRPLEYADVDATDSDRARILCGRDRRAVPPDGGPAVRARDPVLDRRGSEGARRHKRASVHRE